MWAVPPLTNLGKSRWDTSSVINLHQEVDMATKLRSKNKDQKTAHETLIDKLVNKEQQPTTTTAKAKDDDFFFLPVPPGLQQRDPRLHLVQSRLIYMATTQC